MCSTNGMQYEENFYWINLCEQSHLKHHLSKWIRCITTWISIRLKKWATALKFYNWKKKQHMVVVSSEVLIVGHANQEITQLIQNNNMKFIWFVFMIFLWWVNSKPFIKWVSYVRLGLVLILYSRIIISSFRFTREQKKNILK